MMQSIPVGTRWQYGIVDFTVNPPDYLVVKPVNGSQQGANNGQEPVSFIGVRFATPQTGGLLATSFTNIANFGLPFTYDEDGGTVRWLDVNADGLPDALYADRTWKVFINTGGRLIGTTNASGVNISGFDTGSTKTLEAIYSANGVIRYRDIDLVQFTDLDSDGRVDLVAPYALEAMGCYKIRIPPTTCPTPNGNNSPTACNFEWYCPAAPNMALLAAPLDAGKALYPPRFWSSGFAGTQLDTFQIIDHSRNPSIYKCRRFGLRKSASLQHAN